ncbi:MAG: hypothetical protein HZA03_01780 [Nitrospinae bacterium]|nr:hypothetical protein [Nitrospinota bacterium]
MNRKLFGKNLFRAIALPALMVGAVSACTLDKIPGNPTQVLKDYIDAVQKGDFNTIYALSQVTARQKKWIQKSESGDVQKQEAEHFQRHKAIYDATAADMANVQWAEKFFFPPSAKVEIGKPHDPVPAEKKMGDAYEKGVVVVSTVSVSYPKPEEAPEYNGVKVKDAVYECSLRKIRHDESVMIYSYDDKWFFAGCVVKDTSAR